MHDTRPSELTHRRKSQSHFTTFRSKATLFWTDVDQSEDLLGEVTPAAMADKLAELSFVSANVLTMPPHEEGHETTSFSMRRTKL